MSNEFFLRTLGIGKDEIMEGINTALETKASVFLGMGCVLKDSDECISKGNPYMDCHKCKIADLDHTNFRNILGGSLMNTNTYPDIGCMGTAFIYRPTNSRFWIHTIFENREEDMNRSHLVLIPKDPYDLYQLNEKMNKNWPIKK